MNSGVELDSIIEVINKANTVGIFTHVSPDGDAIGSSLALMLGLKQIKKEVYVTTDSYSDCFNFLSGVDDIKKELSGNYDVTIALDCASLNRLYDPKGVYSRGGVTICIDHHGSNTYFAKYNYVEADSPAVCMTLVKIFKRLSISITKEIGECLMAGIITDSGGFRYNTVNDETFEFAAQMLDLGVNISDVYFRTFDAKTRPQFELSSIATSRLKFYHDNRIAVTYVTNKDFKKVKALVGDHEGIVNIGRNILGVEVSVFLREDIDGTYKVSLRSNHDIDVSEVAKVFGGGGHKQAAGCTIDTSLDVAIRKLVKEINKIL